MIKRIRFDLCDRVLETAVDFCTAVNSQVYSYISRFLDWHCFVACELVLCWFILFSLNAGGCIQC